MAVSTSFLRRAWWPACLRRHRLTPAYEALDACLRAYGYRPGYGTGAANCRPITGGSGYSLHAFFGLIAFTFWNRYVIPLMALAVDINPPQNPYSTRLITNMPRGMIDAIYRVRTNSGHQVLQWGGYFSRYKDPMHFEVCCTPAQLKTGIDPRTLPGGAHSPTPTPTPSPTPTTGDTLVDRIYWLKQGNGPTEAHRCLCAKPERGTSVIIWATHHITSLAELASWRKKGLLEANTGATPLVPRSYYEVHGGAYDNTVVY